MTETVRLAIYNTMADWEPGYAMAHIAGSSWQRDPGRYQVRTVAATSAPVVTMGGIRVVPDLAIDELRPADSALLVLPGDATWGEGGNREMASKARAFLDAGVPVAAICGATFGLAREGLLDDRAHTSNAREYLAISAYQGGALYRDDPVVTDRGLITAGAVHAVEFAGAIFEQLGLFTDDVLDAWLRLYRDGDAGAYPVLAAAAERNAVGAA